MILHFNNVVSKEVYEKAESGGGQWRQKNFPNTKFYYTILHKSTVFGSPQGLINMKICVFLLAATFFGTVDIFAQTAVSTATPDTDDVVFGTRYARRQTLCRSS